MQIANLLLVTLRCGIWEISKRSLISTVTSTVHTSPSQKRSFSKTLFKPGEFENVGFVFIVDGKHFENRAFQKRWRLDYHEIPPSPTPWVLPSDCCVFEFLRGSVDGFLVSLREIILIGKVSLLPSRYLGRHATLGEKRCVTTPNNVCGGDYWKVRTL